MHLLLLKFLQIQRAPCRIAEGRSAHWPTTCGGWTLPWRSSLPISGHPLSVFSILFSYGSYLQSWVLAALLCNSTWNLFDNSI